MQFAGRISVFGGRDVSPQLYQDTITIGKRMAENNYLVFCGGGNGVMEAISRGVHEGEGTVIGIMKGMETGESNPYVHIPVYTNMGIGRNPLLAYNCDVALAVGGKYGTLSEIAYALQCDKPVIGFQSWQIDGMISVNTIDDVFSEISRYLNGHNT